VHVIFETDNLEHTIGQVISENGLSQIRMAETEKYPHVTFFFSGGREQTFPGENRIMVPSPKVATYDLQPEMSAKELTEDLLVEIEKGDASFICINYANADMVGHTGVFSAVVRAVETVDACVQKVVTLALKKGYTIFLTADHGNADYMINPDGSPNTAHTLNLVPYFVIDKEWNGKLKPGKLADVAPTILWLMGLPVPKEMTGELLTS
jgi:2,3-bisphosphoglycerate-independent phosphoglycerate mutase